MSNTLTIVNILFTRNSYAATGKAFITFNDIAYTYDFSCINSDVAVFSSVKTPLSHGDVQTLRLAISTRVYGY